ncbi:cytosolic protein [Robertmurraya yapensis]|uniref:Cytosolic protein n=2 Tax=Bacillaceae TaxID=186817 RepID=A0A431W6B5_9BACI|nr:cytosolic protein [Bacillus yapensis]RTR31032.1 cytosolic protein [Bacillus yapensis]TKS95461.1 cytosolic protein [Bacillus yapensis]
MKAFTVNFHKEDQVDSMNVQKLSEEDFSKVTEGGTRHLFELDTNIGFFVYFDAVNNEGVESYLVLHYEDEQEEPSGCYAFELKDFYQFAALHLNDLEFHDEVGEEEEEEEEYSPIHHLAHLMYHIIEEGKNIQE